MIKKSFVATPVLKDKFWIINEGDTKVGTLARDNDNYIFSGKGEISFYTDKSELLKKFGKNLKENRTQKLVLKPKFMLISTINHSVLKDVLMEKLYWKVRV